MRLMLTNRSSRLLSGALGLWLGYFAVTMADTQPVCEFRKNLIVGSGPGNLPRGYLLFSIVVRQARSKWRIICNQHLASTSSWRPRTASRVSFGSTQGRCSFGALSSIEPPLFVWKVEAADQPQQASHRQEFTGSQHAPRCDRRRKRRAIID